MKMSYILKGLLGIVLIYLVCLPICAIGKTIEINNSSAELSQSFEVEKTSEIVAGFKPKKVEFSPTCKARLISPDEKQFIDGYFSIDSGKHLATQRGLIKS